MSRPVDFMDLANSEKFREFFGIARRLTGILLVLTDPTTRRRVTLFSPEETNPICAFLQDSGRSEACALSVRDKCREARENRQASSYICHAGLIDLAAPVFVSGRHVATLIGGQVLPERPTAAGFESFAARLGLSGDEREKARAAFFANPWMPQSRVDDVLRLVCLFSEYFYEVGERIREVGAKKEHPVVTRAKRHIRENMGKTIAFRDVVARCRVAPAYFCWLFKSATGATFTEYLAGARAAEAAKRLEKTDARIIEIAFAVGFGSLSQFNRAFKKYWGATPRQYRERTRSAGR